MSTLEKVVNEYSQNKKTKLIERVACYIRVSTDEQKLHGISLDAQRDKLTDYANKHNLKIVEWYEDEGVSGRKLIKNRPELQRMIKDAQAGLFDRIIFIKLDRFFRSIAEYHECMKLIDPVLWTSTEEKYDLTTANGRAFVNMKVTISELEADQTGERINLVNEYKVKTGQPLSGNQGIAFTVGRDTNTGLKNVIKDPETEELVSDLINYFLTHQNKRQTMSYINKKYGTKYNYNAVGILLHDTKLYGHYRGNDNYCEPYIDKPTFNKIQTILAKNIKQPKTNRVYLFSGLIKCPICGTNLVGNFTNRQSVKRDCGRVDKYNKEVYSYRCRRNNKDKNCSFNKSKTEKKIENYLLDTLETYINGHIKKVNAKDNSVINDTAADQIKELREELKRLNNMYRKNRISEADYDRDCEDIEAQIEELEAQLDPPEERDLTVYEDLIKSNWRDLYNALNKENKRAFWRKYVKEIKIDEEFTVIEPIFF